MTVKNDVVTVKVEALYEWLHEIMLQSGQFPLLALTQDQRRGYGGQIQEQVAELVQRVGRGMRAHPQLFAEQETAGEALLERQRRARAWRCLADGFLLLHEWAYDWYLLEQGTVARDAMAILTQVQREEPPASNGPRWRRMALAAALELLEQRRRKRRKHKGPGNDP